MKYLSCTILVVLLATFCRAQLLCFYCEDCGNYIAEVEACGINNPAPEVSTTTVATPLPTTGDPILTPSTNPDQTSTPEASTTTTTPSTSTDDPILTPSTNPDQTATPEFSTTTTITSTNPDDPIITPSTNPDQTSTPEVSTTTTTASTTPRDPILTPPEPIGTTTTTTSTAAPTSGAPILTPPTIPNWNPSHGVDPPITEAWQARGGRIVIPIEPYVPYACTVIRVSDGQREIVRRGCARLGNNNDQTCSNLSGGHHTQCTVCMTHLCNSGM
ncbi:mucin-2 isoform X2 [Wyeomyia smithii]|uniref:mucin-2 isoform X2 n=1 Tax=Wyeomyia smithii TaxID=174621 RepID=UPI002467E10C|nr:mucin-2 isoform X2 [Wyeomyia smithii]